MALAMLGDIHGRMDVLKRIVDEVKRVPSIKALIQVGDFGVIKDNVTHLNNKPLDFPVYFCDGNHEDFGILKQYHEVTEIAPNVFYCPRGTVLELDGKTVAFMGGAASVDKEYRLKRRMMWHEEENITFAQMEAFRRNTKDRKIDIMIAHNAPQWMVQKYFDSNNLLMFGLPNTWKDYNADYIEQLWNEIGQPQFVCGHMHKPIVDGNCRILDINQLYVVP